MTCGVGTKKRGVVYEPKGILDGREYQTEVSAGGKILGAEQEDDDGEDEDRDDGEHATSRPS